jgi:hypothetical protein
MLSIFFAVAAVETFAGVATLGEGGWGGLEVHMNLMQPRVFKVSFFFFDILDLPGCFIWKA